MERERGREQWKTHWLPIVRARTQICPLMPEQAISSIRSVRRGQRAGEQSAAATMKVDAEAKAAAATHNEIIYNIKTTAAATTTWKYQEKEAIAGHTHTHNHSRSKCFPLAKRKSWGAELRVHSRILSIRGTLHAISLNCRCQRWWRWQSLRAWVGWRRQRQRRGGRV